MNNITTFIISLIILLESKEKISIREFGEKNGFTLEGTINFLQELSKSPFYEDSQINLKFEFNNEEIFIIKNEDKMGTNGEFGNLGEFNDDECSEDTDMRILEISFSDVIEKLEEKKLKEEELINEVNQEKTKELRKIINEINKKLNDFNEIKISTEVDNEKLEALKNMFLRLDNKEEFELYNIVNNKETESFEAAQLIKEILKSNHEEKFNFLKYREVVKIPDINIRCNIDKIIALYDYIEQGDIVDIINKNGAVTSSVRLKRVYYDLDAHTWKLEFLRKGTIESIRLDNLDGDIDESIVESETKVIGKERNKNTSKLVDFRVYNEENAKEKALRYSVKYKMELKKIMEEYTDICIDIQDEEKFLRWVRTMTPSVVILAPESLRQRMIEEIKEWDKVYK